MKAIALAQTLISLQDILAQNPIVKNKFRAIEVPAHMDFEIPIHVKKEATTMEINQLVLDVQSFGFPVDLGYLPNTLYITVKYKPISQERTVGIERMKAPVYRRGIKHSYAMNVASVVDGTNQAPSCRYAPDLYTALFKARPAHVACIKLKGCTAHPGIPLILFTPQRLMIAPARAFTTDELKSIRSASLERNPFA